jgi:hypothetical protein
VRVRRTWGDEMRSRHLADSTPSRSRARLRVFLRPLVPLLLSTSRFLSILSTFSEISRGRDRHPRFRRPRSGASAVSRPLPLKVGMAEAPIFSNARIVRWSELSEDEREKYTRFFVENDVTVRRRHESNSGAATRSGACARVTAPRRGAATRDAARRMSRFLGH